VPKFIPNWLIFTDLDGTLMDDRYDVKGACAALDEVARLGNVCFPTTSKTYAEMLALNNHRTFPSAAVFENGAGILWTSSSEPDLFGRPAEEIYALLDQIRADYGYAFTSFSDMSVMDLMAMTGLDYDGAQRAKTRIGSEPLLWRDSEQAFTDFRELLSQIGLQAVQGGAFVSIMDTGCSKGAALEKIVSCYQHGGPAPGIMACGDAPNDLTMLTAADTAVIFPDRQGNYLSLDVATPVFHAPCAGHEAWLTAVHQALSCSNPDTLAQAAKS
tara:strand:+ start:3833 stop:4648 length:816 start_codon:yes stop_codon:yes gene_type:complete